MQASLRFIGNLLTIMVLFTILFTFAMFQGGFVSWFLFFSFLPIFLYHLGLLFYPIQNWQITRSISNNIMPAGETASIQIHIKRTIPFPLYYCIIEEVFPKSLMDIHYKNKYKYINESKLPTFERRLKKIMFPWFKKHITVPYEVSQTPRGEHTLSKVRVRTGDVFGFIKKEYTFNVETTLSAFPNAHTLQVNKRLSSFEQGTATALSLKMNQSNLVSGIREYVPGDKFSHIDWKQTARREEIMTKEFEQERSTNTVILFDAYAFDGMSTIDFEASIEMVLSLSATLEREDSHVAILSVGSDIVYFPTLRDQNEKERVRTHFTHIQPSDNRTFPVALEQEVNVLNSRPAVVIVTNHMDDSFVQSVKKMRQRIWNLVIILVRSTTLNGTSEDERIEQLRYEGQTVCVLTERELMRNTIEVNM